MCSTQRTCSKSCKGGYHEWQKKRLIDANELEEKAIYITGPKGSACHAVPLELILVPRTNTYINLNHCSTPDEFKADVIEGVSRFAFKAFTKPLCKEHLDGINKLLDTKFTPEDMEYIYTNLGNGINHELCMKFVKSGYDLKVIEESV